MSAERFFDDLARTLAEPMPRRRAVRVIGVSLAALAIPGVSPNFARATLTRPRGRGVLDQAKCPDGSVCNPGLTCCNEKSPTGGYTCRGPNQTCCCGNTQCDPGERCICPAPGGVQGVCAPKCKRDETECGFRCCPSGQRCKNKTSGLCQPCPPDRPVACGSECCDRSEELCLDVYRFPNSGVKRRQCVLKCQPGKRRCIDADRVLGDCCPSGFPCCGRSCGCDAGEECASLTLDRGTRKFCLPKCRAPKKRCHASCCTPDRMYTDRLANGMTICRCRP